MSQPENLNDIVRRLKYHEKGCLNGYLNPVTEWAGGSNLVIVAYECPECKKRTPVEELSFVQ